MKTNIASVILLVACSNVLTLAGNDRCKSSAEVVPICTILSDAAKYDGKEITVKGLYRMVLHGSILTSAVCRDSKVNLKQASDYKSDKRAAAEIRSLTKRDQFRSVDVVLRGTFRVAQPGQCFGQNCLSYEIEEHELLCAKAPMPQASTMAHQSRPARNEQVHIESHF